ncbi:MAG: hypothetical protein PF689_01680 [Deltaproteobacteria bacterium]|jgi:hypothetical protein|nr:hypothetical protein [Deltaproteobacteria bacterium]
MKSSTCIVVFVAILSMVYIACNSDEKYKDLCKEMTECNTFESQTDCMQSFGVLVLSDECTDLMYESECTDHNSNYPSYRDTCFPECSPDEKYCENNKIYYCKNGHLSVYDCYRVCRYSQEDLGSYSGSCGAYGPNGEVSDEGAVCWCEAQ